MRARLLVIAAFVSASTVPGLLAFSTGVLPGRALHAAELKKASQEFRVTSLRWPQAPLGLTSTSEVVVWVQRAGGNASGGLGAYDVPSQRPAQLVDASSVGQNAADASMSDDFLAWAAQTSGGAAGHTGVKALDRYSGRLFTVTGHGTRPSVSGNEIVWVTTKGDGGHARNGFAVLNAVTDEHFAIGTSTHVREVALCGRWIAWIMGPSTATSVWTTSNRGAKRVRLAAGTHVAIDDRRVVWAARTVAGETVIAARDLRSARTTTLCRVKGEVNSLSLANGVVVWSQSTGDGDIWAYDFGNLQAFPVCADQSRQACPTLVGRAVFWADKRSGQWELYGRALQP
jgi:hypothetical protein